jgi:hypothetical protein
VSPPERSLRTVWVIKSLRVFWLGERDNHLVETIVSTEVLVVEVVERVAAWYVGAIAPVEV